MPLTEVDYSQNRSPGSRIVAGIGVLFWFITSLPLLAVFAVEAAWAKWTGKDDDSP